MAGSRNPSVHHYDHASFYEVYEDNISLQKTLPSAKALYSNKNAMEAMNPGDNSSDDDNNAAKRFGTMFGVYLPCLQNILGVILFIRLPWIVSQAGTVLTTVIVALCVLSTSLTALSMSALATNGKVGAGGPYGILLQNLGPEIAGSIGVLFYLGTTIAGTMYALGGVEAMFTSFDLADSLFTFDRQIIAILWTLMLGSIVFAGMKWVAKVSLLFLTIVLMAVTLMTLGAFLFAGGAKSPDGVEHASALNENMRSNFTLDPDTGRTPSFTSLIALFYPSVTGIMAGSNRSGVLADPGRSIPKGTLSAIGTTTLLYLITVWVFGLTVANETLKTNKLVASSIAWPHPYVVAIGIIMSCVGAGLQSLAGAPQLLKSIANDGHIPFLRVFGTKHPDDEPRRAVMFTTGLAATVCLAGNLDYITPIITMFFLSMYGSINLACFLSGVLKSPSFRPTWRYFHWSTALLGFLVCAVMMFVISAIYAFVAIVLVCFVYIYIRSHREKKEWGSALFGLRMDQAMNALLDLSDMSRDRMRRARRRRRRERHARRRHEKQGSLLEDDASTFSRRTLSWLRFSSSMPLSKKTKLNDGSVVQTNDIEAQTNSHDSDSSSSYSDFEDSDDDASSLGGDYGADANDAFRDAAGGTTTEKNWRPQILVLCKLDPKHHPRHSADPEDAEIPCPRKPKNFQVSNPSLLRLASQLKKGRGLTIITSVLHGDIMDESNKVRCANARYLLSNELVNHDVRGFTDVVMGSGPNLLEPLRVLFQSKGLGMLSPNTVMLGWPQTWREVDETTQAAQQQQQTQSPRRSKNNSKNRFRRHNSHGSPLGKEFGSGSNNTKTSTETNHLIALSHKESYVQLLKDAIGCQKALMVVKAKTDFPEEPAHCTSTIDVWWLIHDGDMLVMLPYLLRRHRVWAGTKLRIFAIADDLVNFGASQAALRKHLQDLRIEAHIEMIHVGASHARDVDQNRTVMVRPSDQGDQNRILSANMFKPLAEDGDPPSPSDTSFPSASIEATGNGPNQDGSDVEASQHRHRGPLPLIRSLSRRASLERGRPLHDPALSGAPDLGQIAEHIRNSSGEETQRWIQEKYGSRPSNALQSLFAPMNNIEEEDGVEEHEVSLTDGKEPQETSMSQLNKDEQTKPADGCVESNESSFDISRHAAPTGRHHTNHKCRNNNLEEPFYPEMYPAFHRRATILNQRANDTERLTKRLRTAEYLNAKIREHSLNADLVVLNLPLSRTTPTQEFIQYTETLTSGLPRVVMLRGHGNEHVKSL